LALLIIDYCCSGFIFTGFCCRWLFKSNTCSSRSWNEPLIIRDVKCWLSCAHSNEKSFISKDKWWLFVNKLLERVSIFIDCYRSKSIEFISWFCSKFSVASFILCWPYFTWRKTENEYYIDFRSSFISWIIFFEFIFEFSLPVNFIRRFRERPLWSWSFWIRIWVFNPCIIRGFPMFNSCFQFVGLIIWIEWLFFWKSIRTSCLWKQRLANSWELILTLKTSFDMLVMLIILRSYHFRCLCSIDSFMVSMIVI